MAYTTHASLPFPALSIEDRIIIRVDVVTVAFTEVWNQSLILSH